MMKRVTCIFIALCILTITPMALAEGEESYTDLCNFTASNDYDTTMLIDGNYRSYWKTADDDSFIDIETPEGAHGIVVSWSYQPDTWELYGSDDQVSWKLIEQVDNQRFLQQHIAIEKPYTYYRIQLPKLQGDRYGICEIALYKDQIPPSYIHIWDDTAEKAELMVISAHADDETVFFGGTLPYYSGEEQKDTVVIFMATNNYVRRQEALNALWVSGVRTYPVFASFPDEYCRTIEECIYHWGKMDKVVDYLVEQIRVHRPDVIVTHDVDGEYGHGAHKMTSAATQQAVLDAKDPSAYPESVKRYGVWDTPKLYLHLYKEYPIYMDCYEKPLVAFGGKTAIEVANEALPCHASQMKWEVVRVHHEGKFNCHKYGLAYSSVGYDTVADFFANVPIPTPVPTATPEPTPTLAPTPTVSPIPCPSVTVTPPPKEVVKENIWQRFITWLRNLLGV